MQQKIVPTAKARDLRIDFIRGMVMSLVVVGHLPVPSLFYVLSVERIGVVTGAELFVFVSGLVVGMTHRRRIEERGWKASALTLLKRAFQLYLVVIAVDLSIWALKIVPTLDRDVLMAWTDPRSGEQMRLFPPYPLQDPMATLLQLLTLRVTPWQFNIIGLYVFLILLTPMILKAFRTGHTASVLLLSWIFYVANFWLHLRLTSAAFESPCPVLTWQMPYLHALAIGFHRRAIGNWIQGHRKFLISLSAILSAMFIFYAWNNPWRDVHPYSEVPDWARLSVIPENTFNSIYVSIFKERTWLGIGRLINLATGLLFLFFVLSRWWEKANRYAGWFFIPLGQASLYVFILHLYAILIVAQIPGLDRTTTLINTFVATVVLLTLWWCVRKRFLFRIIPR